MTKYCITPTQRTVHVTSEAAGLFVVAPFLFWLGQQKGLSPGARNMASALAVATVVVDGYLLGKYLGMRELTK